MSERLTDAELTEALEVAQGLHSLKLTAAVAELIDRRRADLTEFERVQLLALRVRLQSDPEILPVTLALLDKLLGGGR